MKYKLVIEKDSEEEIIAVLNGSKWWQLVYNLDDTLKTRLAFDTIPEDKRIAFEEVREFISNFMLENQIDLYEL